MGIIMTYDDSHLLLDSQLLAHSNRLKTRTSKCNDSELSLNVQIPL